MAIYKIIGKKATEAKHFPAYCVFFVLEYFFRFSSLESLVQPLIFISVDFQPFQQDVSPYYL